MLFRLQDVPRFEGGPYVLSTDYEALEKAYVKLRHELLELMDNPNTDDAYKGEQVERMIAYAGLRASVSDEVAERLMPEVAPEKVPALRASQQLRSRLKSLVDLRLLPHNPGGEQEAGGY